MAPQTAATVLRSPVVFPRTPVVFLRSPVVFLPSPFVGFTWDELLG